MKTLCFPPSMGSRSDPRISFPRRVRSTPFRNLQHLKRYNARSDRLRPIVAVSPQRRRKNEIDVLRTQHDHQIRTSDFVPTQGHKHSDSRFATPLGSYCDFDKKGPKSRDANLVNFLALMSRPPCNDSFILSLTSNKTLKLSSNY